MEIHMLPAGAGDCFFINYTHHGAGRNIWVDGGLNSTYRSIKKEIRSIIERGEVIDLLVLTHVDADHIRGVLKFFSDKEMDCTIVKRVLFNCAATISSYLRTSADYHRETPMENSSKICSFTEGATLEKVLRSLGLLEEKPIKAGDIVDLPGAKLYILSPDRQSLEKLNRSWEYLRESGLGDRACRAETDYNILLETLQKRLFQPDTSPANQASIAFLLEQRDKKALMLADSSPEVVEDSLMRLGYSEENKLRLNFVKLSHHGGRKNTSDTLMKLLDCSTYLISSNRADCPSKEVLAKIIRYNKHPKFFCNYEKSNILLPQEENVCTIIKKCEVEL